MKGKQHRRSYIAVGRRAIDPLGIIHSDLCGKMSIASRSGALYFILLLMIKVDLLAYTSLNVRAKHSKPLKIIGLKLKNSVDIN